MNESWKAVSVFNLPKEKKNSPTNEVQIKLISRHGVKLGRSPHAEMFGPGCQVHCPSTQKYGVQITTSPAFLD